MLILLKEKLQKSLKELQKVRQDLEDEREDLRRVLTEIHEQEKKEAS